MRVPLSWLNEFLPRPMSAREVDDALGEAGITVTVIDAPGRLSPRVVAGRVRTTDVREPVVDLPTPERVSLPSGTACPPPGTMVAVALPGSRLFAPGPPGETPSRHGLTTVPPPKRDGDPVGRLCTPAELGTGPDHRGYCVLPDTAKPGVAVAAVLAGTAGPGGGRAEVLPDPAGPDGAGAAVLQGTAVPDGAGAAVLQDAPKAGGAEAAVPRGTAMPGGAGAAMLADAARLGGAGTEVLRDAAEPGGVGAAVLPDAPKAGGAEAAVPRGTAEPGGVGAAVLPDAPKAGGAAGAAVLPDPAGAAGEPAPAATAERGGPAPVVPAGFGFGLGGEEILHLTVPDALAHCTGLWGLAYEIGSREGMPGAGRSDGRREGTLDVGHIDGHRDGTLGTARSHDHRTAPVAPASYPELTVARPDWTVSAVLVPTPSTRPVPVPLLARMTLAGIGTSDSVIDALNVAAYEYGTRLAAFPVPGTGPVGVVVGTGAEPEPEPEREVRWPAELPVRVGPGADAGDTPRLLVLAACPSVLDADIDRCTEAARRAARLLSGADVQGVRTTSGPVGERRHIALDVAAVRAALGLDLTTGSCAALLARIGARASRTEGEVLDVSLPPSRTELRTAADLVSEVMRLHGYRALPATTPTDPVPRHRDPRGARLRALRDAMAVRGFQESLTPLVLDPGTVTVGAPWCEPAVHLEQNGEPLTRTLRRSLVPGLLAVAGGALRHGPRCAVFETGTVVRPEHAGQTPGGEEDAFTVLRTVPADAGVAGAGAEAGAGAGAGVEENLREVGAAVRAAVRAAGVTRFELRPADLPGFRPGTGAVILADGVETGGLGILTGARGPAHHEVAVAEIDLTLLLRLPHAHRTLSAPPRHPAVELDVNLLVPDGIPSGELPRTLCAGSPLVRSARVSDVYRGRGVPPGHRAITVTLGFASPWRTLTRAEATTACAQAVAAAEPLGVRRR